MLADPKALIELGYQARREHRLSDAGQGFVAAVRLCREGNDSVLLARALTGLGQIERDLGGLGTALEHYLEVATIYRSLDCPLVLAHTIRHAGDILRNQGKLNRAAPYYEEALAIYRSREDTPRLDLGNAVRGYALLKADCGDIDEAAKLWREARELYAEVGVKAGIDEADAQIARLTAG